MPHRFSLSLQRISHNNVQRIIIGGDKYRILFKFAAND
ncbi:hypothetical protein B194_3848 [Serratia plymuthica A30]|nr:hypothetical protein B194_3848 [Serratia plymuthica A30]